MIIRIFFTLVINLFFVSCSKEDQLSEKDLWYSLNIDNYEMTQQISCFCFPYEFVLPKSIKVENDKIVSIDGKDPMKTVGTNHFIRLILFLILLKVSLTKIQNSMK